MTTVTSRYNGSIKNEVSLNDPVKKGDTLCFISAGGLNLTVNSPCDGMIQKIYAADGDSIHRNDPLYDIATPVVVPATPNIT